jgi:predicted site-specific integrase-resolvase
MSTLMPHADRPAFHTVSEAAWLLGVPPATLHRAIRIGTLRAVWRRSRLVIPATELVRLLPHTASNGAGQAGDAP